MYWRGMAQRSAPRIKIEKWVKATAYSLAESNALVSSVEWLREWARWVDSRDNDRVP